MKNRKFNFKNDNVKKIFDAYPKNLKVKLLFLRELIIDTANRIKEVGDIDETLKWNEPSYAPAKPKIGSPIRINSIKNSEQYAIYFNCQSNLVATFKQIYPETFTYIGNRSIVFNISDKVPIKELRHCISLALTYHLNKSSFNPSIS